MAVKRVRLQDIADPEASVRACVRACVCARVCVCACVPMCACVRACVFVCLRAVASASVPALCVRLPVCARLHMSCGEVCARVHVSVWAECGVGGEGGG